MSVRQTKSLTPEQSWNLLDDHASDEEDQSEDVFILPLDVNELTDHEDIDVEMMGNMIVTEVAGSLELHVATSEFKSIKPTNVVEKGFVSRSRLNYKCYEKTQSNVLDVSSLNNLHPLFNFCLEIHVKLLNKFW